MKSPPMEGTIPSYFPIGVAPPIQYGMFIPILFRWFITITFLTMYACMHACDAMQYNAMQCNAIQCNANYKFISISIGRYIFIHW